MTLTRSLVAVVFSGASALTLEILWQRQMFLVFGASAPAVTAVLTAMFLGIALDSRLAKTILSRTRDRLRGFAIAEVGVGLFGIAVPVVLPIANKVYVAAAHQIGEGQVLLSVIRFLLAILLLMPSTLCMGMTIPLMAAGLSDSGRSRMSWIYGFNLIGAVLGATICGLFLIRALGHAASYSAVAILSGLAASLTFFLRSQSAAAPDPDERRVNQAEVVSQIVGLKPIYFAAGFVALGLEVVWLRCLGIINTNSSITFALSLCSYLLGMGLGSLALFPLLNRFLKASTILAVGNLGAAAATLVTLPLLFQAPALNYQRISLAVANETLTLNSLYATEAMLTFGLMFLPALFMGVVFPAVCMAVDGSAVAKDRWAGEAGFIGTLGAVFGILLTSMFIIPMLGLHGTLASLVSMSALLGGIVFFQHERKSLRIPVGLTALIVVGISVSFAIQARPVLRDFTSERIGDAWFEVSNTSGREHVSEIRSFRAGPTGTVIIKKKPDSPDHLVYVDDQLVASTNLGARVDSLMLAHLPLLLHPRPFSELTVGFGTGGTSHAITTHNVDAYCVEIEPEVPRVASFLRHQNFDVLTNPRFQLILNDARDHLAISQRFYDVIATDVTNLQYRQNSSLYTTEYFERMKSRLHEDGIACAWIPMAAINTEELRILMRSFQSVFPHASLWYMNHTHTNFGILIGTPRELSISYARMQEGMQIPSAQENLALIGISHPLQIVQSLMLDEDGYRRFCGDGPLHTDDHPVLEFTSPLSFYQYKETFVANLRETMRYRPASLRPLVNDFPVSEQLLWEAHATASLRFCEVMTAFYDYLIAMERHEPDRAVRALRRAIEAARTGMGALPDDQIREQFYIDFFEQAQSKIERRP